MFRKLYLSWIPLCAAAFIVLIGGAALSLNQRVNIHTKPVPPAEWVVMTRSSDKYHRHGCSALRKSKMMNVLYRTDAIERGYTPCKICKPDGDEPGTSASGGEE